MPSPDSSHPAPPAPAAPPAPLAAPRPRAVLPIVALVVSVVACCPVCGLVGALLGVIALRRASKATPPAVRDRRIAVTAIAVGALSLLLWSIGIDRFAASQRRGAEEQMTAAIARLLGAAESQAAADAVSRSWAGTELERPAPQAVAAIASGAHERWGRFRSADVMSSAISGSLFALEQRSDVAIVLRFERGSVTGSARFRHVVVPGRFTPELRLERIVIEDRERGDLALGFTETESGRERAPAGEPAGGVGRN